MSSQFIIHVTETNFENEVVNFSHNIPVVVDFWAEWCVPCKMLDPILRKLTNDYEGQFRLAKVNVDENQNLAMRFNVRGIPIVKAFRNGIKVSEFSGIQPETKIRKFLKDILPSSSDLNLEKANSLLSFGNWKQAADVFRLVIHEQPGNPNALLGLSKCLIALGRGSEARDILNSFPVSHEFASAERLKPITEVINLYRTHTPELTDPIDRTYFHTLTLISLGNLPAAMDGILEVLRLDKNYRAGEARLVILGLFEIIGLDNPIIRQYQSELASLLF